jgi:hypothetical protein
MENSMNEMIDNQLKLIIKNLVSDGIVNTEIDENGCMTYAFTEEGKAFMEVLAFNLSHRIESVVKNGDIKQNEKDELESILKRIKNLP